MWYENVRRTYFRFVTMHSFDEQTNGQKGLGNTVRWITCSCTVKVTNIMNSQYMLK